MVLAGLTAAALAALWAAAVVRRRLRFRGARRDPAAAPAPWLASQLAAGMVVALILILAERVISAIVDASTIDLRHFSLHPWNATRAGLLGGLLAVQVDGGVGVDAGAVRGARRLAHALATLEHARNPARRRWTLPTIVAVPLLIAAGTPLPPAGVLIACGACALAAVVSRGVAVWYPPRDRGRRASSRSSSPFSPPRSCSIRRSTSSPSARRGA